MYYSKKFPMYFAFAFCKNVALDKVFGIKNKINPNILPLSRNNDSHLQSWWRRSRLAASKIIIARQRNQETNRRVVAFGRNGEVSSSLVPRLGPRRVRSYLREDLLFGKSFSRCQPAAGRTELTARTSQFLFPLPLPSSTSGLRLFPLFAVSYPFACKHSSFEFDSAGLHLCSPQLEVEISQKVTTNSIVSLDNANWTTALVTIIWDITVHHRIDIQIVEYL